MLGVDLPVTLDNLGDALTMALLVLVWRVERRLYRLEVILNGWEETPKRRP